MCTAVYDWKIHHTPILRHGKRDQRTVRLCMSITLGSPQKIYQDLGLLDEEAYMWIAVSAFNKELPRIFLEMAPIIPTEA